MFFNEHCFRLKEVECGKGMKCVLNKDQCTSEICCGAARCGQLGYTIEKSVFFKILF